MKGKVFQSLKKIALSSTCLLTQRQLELIEAFGAQGQGKGIGHEDVAAEVREALKLLNGELKTFVDVGANQGDYAQNILKMVHKAECLLFEPQPSLYRELKNRFKNESAVYVYDIALSDVNGQARMYRPCDGAAYASLSEIDYSHHNFKMNEVLKVSTQRFDSLTSSGKAVSGRIDFVKIDVEGHELEVLQGFGERVKDVRLFQFEFGYPSMYTKTYFKGLWDFFESSGFELYRITPYRTVRIESYSERHETLATTNYFALNGNQ